jgi:hypothetical protein
VDSGDVLALYFQNISHQGGNQRLASSWQIYNALARESPDVIRILAENWPWENLNMYVATFSSDSNVDKKPLLTIKSLTGTQRNIPSPTSQSFTQSTAKFKLASLEHSLSGQSTSHAPHPPHNFPLARQQLWRHFYLLQNGIPSNSTSIRAIWCF